MEIDKTGRRIVTDEERQHREEQKAGWNATGMQAVDCPLCGENLGYQDARQDVEWEYWQHSRCPVRIAQHWGITEDEVEDLTKILVAAIATSFPDFGLPPPERLEGTDSETFRAFRSRICAGHIMEVLAGVGYRIVVP